MNPLVSGISLFIALAAMVVLLWKLKDARRTERQAVVHREEVVNFLNRFGDSIVTSSDSRRWLKTVSGYLAEAVNAKALRLFECDDNGTLTCVGSSGELPVVGSPEYRLTKSGRLLEHLSSDTIEAGAGLIGEIALTEKSVLEAEFNGRAGRASAAAGVVESLLAVPIHRNNQTVGVICAVNKREGDERFSTDDLFLLESLSNQIAVGMTLVDAYDNIGEQHRIQQQLLLAREIQESLLPEKAPLNPGFATYGVNKAAQDVSGDFYDFVEIDDDFLLVVIADASGKGIPACMLMAMCRSFVRSNAGRFREDLEGLFRELNTNLFHDTDGAQFVTMACCLIDKRDLTVKYARAGHTALLMRSPSGEVQEVVPDGPAMGLLPDDMEIRFDTLSFSWRPGTSILMFTDGITEALNSEDEEYGLKRLKALWQAETSEPEAAAANILTRLAEFTGERSQVDDQTLVVLSRNGT